MKNKICGQYLITCKRNGKRYVGSSVDIHKRWIAHKTELRQQTHHCKPLQYAWNKYGEEDFIIEVLQETEPEIRVTVEIEWFKKIKPEFNTMEPDLAPQSWTFTQDIKNELRKKHPSNTSKRGEWLANLKAASDRRAPVRESVRQKLIEARESAKRIKMESLINSWPKGFQKLIDLACADPITMADTCSGARSDLETPSKHILHGHLHAAFGPKFLGVEIEKSYPNKNIGQKRSTEFKKAAADRFKKLWESEEYRKKTLDGMRTPEYIDKQKNSEWNIKQRKEKKNK